MESWNNGDGPLAICCILHRSLHKDLTNKVELEKSNQRQKLETTGLYES